MIGHRVGGVDGAVALAVRGVFRLGTASLRRRNADLLTAEAAYAVAARMIATDVDYLPAGSPLAGPAPSDTRLDVYAPTERTGTEPVVVWIHGGGWLSGDKRDADYYLLRLAARGAVVVAPNYSCAPESRYPLPVRQLAAALRFVADGAGGTGEAADRLVLAGDSAGAQLAAQLTCAALDPGYAAECGLTVPAVPRGVILHCGVYDLPRLADRMFRPARAGGRAVLRAYADRAQLTQMSVLDRVGADFPPALLTGGAGDPLTRGQTTRLAHRLRAAGVDTVHLEFPGERALRHEFQFELDRPQAWRVLDETAAFIGRVCSPDRADR